MDESSNRGLELKLGYRLMRLTELHEAIALWSAFSIWPTASRRCECLTCYQANHYRNSLAILNQGKMVMMKLRFDQNCMPQNITKSRGFRTISIQNNQPGQANIIRPKSKIQAKEFRPP